MQLVTQGSAMRRCPVAEPMCRNTCDAVSLECRHTAYALRLKILLAFRRNGFGCPD